MDRRMFWIRSAALAFLLFGLASVTVAQKGVVTDDTTTHGPEPNLNLGTAPSLQVGPIGSAGQGSAYIRFALTGLPTGTTGNQLAKATLLLWVNSFNGNPLLTVSTVLGRWSELTLTGANAPESGAAIEAGVPITREDQFVAVDVTSLARLWLDEMAPNHGVVLTLSPGSGTGSGGTGAFVLFDSKENEETSHEPQLILTLVGPSGPPGPAGPTGAQGPIGPRGPQGPAGVSQWESRQESTTFSGPLSKFATVSRFVACRASKVILGGGCTTENSSFLLVQSVPIGNGWQCRYRAPDGLPAGLVVTVRVSAICAIVN